MNNKSNWRNVSMGQEGTINVQIDRQTLEIVLSTFDYIHENYHVPSIIEKSRMVISETDIEFIANKLRRHMSVEQDSIVMPMNERDWDTYSCLIIYAKSGLRGITPENIRILDALSTTYGEWEETGFKPDGSSLGPG